MHRCTGAGVGARPLLGRMVNTLGWSQAAVDDDDLVSTRRHHYTSWILAGRVNG